MTILKVGIASCEEMKARTMAVARGEHRASPDEPTVWFTSTEAFAKVLGAGNRELLRAIAEKAPDSLDKLARITGKSKSNLLRTLRTLEGYGLVRLERGERGRITPKVLLSRVELELPLAETLKAGEPALDTSYAAGYAAAMRAIGEFAAWAPAAPTTSPAKPAARRSRRPAANAPTARKRPQRGSNARHITEAMMTLPNHTGPAAAIKRALAEKGHDIPYTSIRHELGQLQARGEATVAKDGQTWSYTAQHEVADV